MCFSLVIMLHNLGGFLHPSSAGTQYVSGRNLHVRAFLYCLSCHKGNLESLGRIVNTLYIVIITLQAIATPLAKVLDPLYNWTNTCKAGKVGKYDGSYYRNPTGILSIYSGLLWNGKLFGKCFGIGRTWLAGAPNPDHMRFCLYNCNHPVLRLCRTVTMGVWNRSCQWVHDMDLSCFKRHAGILQEVTYTKNRESRAAHEHAEVQHTFQKRICFLQNI